MIKTMLGEMHGTCKVEERGKCCKSYLIKDDCGNFWVSEEEFKRIKLPFLGTKERKAYDELMAASMEIGISLYEKGEELPYEPETNAREILEAVIKGGYNS